MNKTHVAVVGTVGLPACYGGFESLVENLVINRSEYMDYTVFSSSKEYDSLLSEYEGAKIKYIPLRANGVQSIPYDILSLIRTLFLKPDVTLILGVSGCIFLPLFRLFYRGRIVTNIDGLEWKRQKWSKWAKCFLKFSEKLAVKFSDVVIADNQAITDYVDEEYNVKAETIAYGGDHALSGGSLNTGKNDSECYFLSICRIEPENNVAMVLDAFAGAQDFNLKFVGNWDRSEYGRVLKEKYKSFTNIEIIDPIYDIPKLFELRNGCLGYVHGHSAGGTNPSLVEAMHFAKPIMAFDCSFNRYTTEDKCFYFSNSDDLKKKLSLFDRKKPIGGFMQEIAQRRYTWAAVREQYEAICTAG